MSTNKPNLSDVLFSKVQQRLLALLYIHPDKTYYTNELIRLSNSGTGAVQRELKKLTDVNLISVKTIGNQKHYAANRDSLYFAELRGIILKTFGLADIIIEALRPITSKIYIAFIYGSIAKQEDTDTSDIDLMILSDDLSYVDIYPYLETAEMQLGRPINPSFYTRSEWSKKIAAANHFLTKIKQQPKIFVIGTNDELSKLG